MNVQICTEYQSKFWIAFYIVFNFYPLYGSNKVIYFCFSYDFFWILLMHHNGIHLYGILRYLNKNASCPCVKMRTIAFLCCACRRTSMHCFVEEVFTHNLVFPKTSYITISLFFCVNNRSFKFKLYKRLIFFIYL